MKKKALLLFTSLLLSSSQVTSQAILGGNGIPPPPGLQGQVTCNSRQTVVTGQFGVPGGWSTITQINQANNAELYNYFVGLQAQVQATSKGTYEIFTPIQYKQQVVAGMKYKIWYSIGAGNYLEVEVYQNLQNVTEINSAQQLTGLPAATQAYSCRDCPPFTRAQSQNTYCDSDKCDHRTQVVSNDGTCTTCPVDQVPAANLRECITKGNTCSDVQVRFGSQCYDCPKYTRAQDDGTVCAPDRCNNFNQIIQTDGLCKTCDEGSHPDRQYKNCLSNSVSLCKGNQIVRYFDKARQNSYCQECQDFTRAQNDNTLCAADQCQSKQIVQKDGTCFTCVSPQVPDARGRGCITEPCSDERGIWLPNGKCSTCPDYTMPLDNGSRCGPSTCQQNQILTKLGECQNCPAGTIPDMMMRNCIQAVLASCGEREVKSFDGQACFPCPNFTRAQDNNQRCGADTCTRSQILTNTGQCFTCLIGTQPDITMRACESIGDIVCNDRQIVSPDKKQCFNCRDYTRRIMGNTCGSPRCDVGQVTTRFGLCKTCSQGTYPDSMQRNCVYQTVRCETDQQILSSDGRSCETCLDYTRAQDNNSYCDSDKCGFFSIVQKDGTCTECPEKLVPDIAKRECIQLNCGARGFTTEDGRECSSCPPYTRIQEDGKCDADECIFSNFFINEEGQCKSCPDGQVSDSKKRECIEKPTVCTGDREIISQYSQACIMCMPYTRAQEGNKICKADDCSDTQIVSWTGACVDCPSGQMADTRGRQCITKPVTSCGEREIFDEIGGCVACSTYTRAQKSNTICMSDICTSQREIVNEEGQCEACPEDTVPGPTMRTCDAVIIYSDNICKGEREIISNDRKSCNRCFPFTRAQRGNTVCAPDKCLGGITTFSGKCELCPQGTFPNNMRRSCITRAVALNSVTEEPMANLESNTSSTKVASKDPSKTIIIIGGVCLVLVITLIVFYKIRSNVNGKTLSSQELELAQIEAEHQANKGDNEAGEPNANEYQSNDPLAVLAAGLEGGAAAKNVVVVSGSQTLAETRSLGLAETRKADDLMIPKQVSEEDREELKSGAKSLRGDEEK